VDLQGHRFKVLVKKGRDIREQWRTIKDLAMKDWSESVAAAADDEFIFSEGLVAGKLIIRPSQVTKRWRVHVKKKLGIKADLYSLKHSNLDETAAALQKHSEAMDQVRRAAGHSEKGKLITMVYTQGEENREHLTVQKIMNEF
jgi:hypothetical protein